ncbi:hypothetical protein PR001_g13674, partial [Phytophthora rubi]
MKFDTGAEDLPVDASMSTGSPNTSATHVAREDCLHLADPEWEALQRLSTVIGEAAVATTLRTLSPTEQHGAALGFIMNEQRETAARATVSTPSTPRVESLKLHVNSYVGREGEPLLRWLVEVDTAITARRIIDPLSKVATYEVFKEELRQAFEPPQNEFRSRAEFLDLQKGKHDVHAYDQRVRYLVSNIVTNPTDEATQVVTFMKSLKDGPVNTYLFRDYPNTLESAITLAIQEEFSLRQAKLHVNAPRPMPRPMVKPSGGPEPMDLSSATAAGSQQRRGPTNARYFRCGNNGHYARECTAPVQAAKGRCDDTGYRHGLSKKLERPAGAGRPAGDAVERIDIGHAVLMTAAPSESHSHCKKQDDRPNLVILKVNSKREKSLRVLVDCGASNNFVRLQSLARLDFEDVVMPRSLLEVRLATVVVVRTERRVVRVRFSYRGKKFVIELIVLDLDDKFNMVLGMPWLARHDPVIDWTKRTIVHFGSGSATVSDGPVGAAHAPRGACDPPAEAARRAAAFGHRTRTPTTERVVGRKCESNQKTQIRSDSRVSRSVKSDAVVSTINVVTRVQQEEPVTNKDSDLDASAPGADAIGANVERRSAVRRRGKEGAPALAADAAGSADGCKRPAPEILACSRAAGLHDEAVRDQAGLDCVRPREEPAGDNKKRIACSRAAGLHEEAIRDQAGLDCVCPRVEPAGNQKEDLSTAGPGQNKKRGTGFRTRSERRKRAKLRKSRSGTEALLAVSAGQTQELETTVETLSVLTRTNTGLQY